MGGRVIQVALISIFAGCLMGCGANSVFKTKSAKPITSESRSTTSEIRVIPAVSLGQPGRRIDETSAANALKNDQPPSEQTVSLEPEPKVIVIEKSTEATELMDFYDKLIESSAKEVDSQSREIKKRYDKKQKPIDGLKYALTLICCSTSYTKDMIALDVVYALKTELKSSEDMALHGIVQLLHKLLVKSIYADALNQASHDQFVTKDGYIEHLEKQISALKSIEKSIHERELGAD